MHKTLKQLIAGIMNAQTVQQWNRNLFKYINTHNISQTHIVQSNIGCWNTAKTDKNVQKNPLALLVIVDINICTIPKTIALHKLLCFVFLLLFSIVQSQIHIIFIHLYTPRNVCNSMVYFAQFAYLFIKNSCVVLCCASFDCFNMGRQN